jgi:hypothetical protein
LPVNNTFNRIENKTFNSVIAFNSKQSTGLHLINVVKPNNGFNLPTTLNTNIQCSYIENAFYFSNLRDYATKAGNDDNPVNLL